MVEKIDYSSFIDNEMKGVPKGDNRNIPYFKIELGDNKLRLLPPFGENKKLFHHVTVHFKIYMDGKPTAVKCTAEEHGRCPICEDYDALMKIGDKTRANEIRATHQFFWNVLTPEETVGVLAADMKVQDKLIEEYKTARQYIKPFDVWGVQDGIWIVINKTQERVPGKKPPFDKKNVFSIVADRDNVCPLTVNLVKKIKDQVVDTTKLYKDYTYEELSAKYYGSGAETTSPTVPSDVPVPAKPSDLTAPIVSTSGSPTVVSPQETILTKEMEDDVAAILAQWGAS